MENPYGFLPVLGGQHDPDYPIFSKDLLRELLRIFNKEVMQPAEKVTFYGQEKADVNTKIAKMNMTVHGLEGNIQEQYFYNYLKPTGRADFVMA